MDLLKLNVAPLAVFQMLKSMCAGQRLASEPQDPAAVSLPTSTMPETRGQLGCSLPVTQVVGGQGSGGGQCQAQRAKPSVDRPFCRSSSPTAHWTQGLSYLVQSPALASMLALREQVWTRWKQNGCPNVAQAD